VGIAAVTSLAPEARIGAGAGGFIFVATGVIAGQRFFPADPGFPNFGEGRRAAADKKRNSPVPGLISGLPLERGGMMGLRGARESELT
jgi:hypothetical protein